MLNVLCLGLTDGILADLKAICLAKWPMRPRGRRPQMIILSARKRFGLWLRKTYANGDTPLTT